MVNLRLAQRLALQRRQFDGDGGLLGDLFGDDDEEETTTRRIPFITSLEPTDTDTLTTRTRLPLFPTPSLTGTDTTETETSTETSTSTTDTSSTTDTTALIPITSSTESTTTTTTPPPPSSTSTESPLLTTVTSFQSAAAASPSASETAAASSKGFLDNKPVAGVVFGLAGLIGLAILVFLITFIVRRSRRKHLLEDAVSFDPSNFVAHSTSNDGLPGMNRPSSIEKSDRYSGSDQGHGYAPSGYQNTYDAPYGGYSNPYNTYGSNYGPAYAGQYNNHPVQLPSVNLAAADGNRPRGASPALPSPVSDSQAYGGYTTHGHAGNNAFPTNLVSDDGSIREANPYLGTKEYKVANA